MFCYLFGPELGGVISMAESPILPEAPRIQVTVRDDGRAMRTTTGDVPYSLRSQRLDQPRFVTVPVRVEFIKLFMYN